MINKLILVAITSAIGFGQDLFELQKTPIKTEFCLLPSNKGYGLCIDLIKCKPAWSLFTEFFISPTYCNYNAFEQTVCCDVNAKNVSLKLVEERVSEQKCKQVYPVLLPFTTIGDIPAEDDEYKHITAIALRTENGGHDYSCGGSLISATFVLTAAQCTSFKGVTPNSVRIGGVKITEAGGEGHISIRKIIIHPEYNETQVYNDIALLELEKPSTYRPACLWQTTEIDDYGAVAIGYGHTTFAGKGSDDLIKVNISIYDFEECRQTYQPGYKLENGLVESQLCGADREHKQNTCPENFSGSLMVTEYKNSHPVPYIVGITSFDQGCASSSPNVYTRVSSYLDWIEPIVWPTARAKGYFRVD